MFQYQFIEGPVKQQQIAQILASMADHTIGAQSVFLGQVRADKIDNKEVQSIEYTSYKLMAHDMLQTVVS